VALLQHGVNPDGHTLKESPLWTALGSRTSREFCNLLIEFKANVNMPGILSKVIQEGDFGLLQTFVKSGVNLEEQGMEALVESAYMGDTASAAFLLNSGVNINTPGLEMNPLQTAAAEGRLEMIELLLSYGADINAPAYLRNGRTALQSALEGGCPLKVASLLLDKGADAFAPPASLNGLTALEALCHRWDITDAETVFCNKLLDAGVPVNRPNGEPSSALHGIISHGWNEVLARFLEPQRNAVVNYMWCDMEMEEDEYDHWEPRTPTQLAADYGHLDQARMLLDYGADINEAPAYLFGRTALQAAVSSENMELVQFLVDKGADINAKPAIHGGITALQGAAISGDIMLAKFLLDKGADVNAAPSFSEGRYAIEGAAEHGRLDMAQLLLNAGALGNVFRGTGFEYAIALAEENCHFPIANLLKSVTKV
jgi:ankyrin repeat protein